MAKSILFDFGFLLDLHLTRLNNKKWNKEGIKGCCLDNNSRRKEIKKERKQGGDDMNFGAKIVEKMKEKRDMTD